MKGLIYRLGVRVLRSRSALNNGSIKRLGFRIRNGV